MVTPMCSQLTYEGLLDEVCFCKFRSFSSLCIFLKPYLSFELDMSCLSSIHMAVSDHSPLSLLFY